MTGREHHEYQGGTWTAVAGDGFLALVEPDAPWRLVDGLWDVARADGDVLGALGVVAADGFSALPRFAVVRVDRDGAVHAVLRGPVRLRLHGADGAQEVADRDGAVWTEHRALGVHGLEVQVDDAQDATWWPLVGGVVRAGGLRTGSTGDAQVAPDTATHEQPVVAAAPPVDAAGDAADPVPTSFVVPVTTEASPAADPEPADELLVHVEPAGAGTADDPADVPGPDEVAAAWSAGDAVDGHVDDQPDDALGTWPVAAPEPAPALLDAPAPFDEPAPVDERAPVAAPALDAPQSADSPEARAAFAWSPSAAAEPLVAEPLVAESSVAPQETAADPVPDIPWWPLPADDSRAPADIAAPLAAPTGSPVAPLVVPAVETSGADAFAAAADRDAAVTDVLEPESDDHDGMTIMSSDLARLRDRLPAWSQDAVPGPFPTPEAAPLPVRMVLSTGLVVALDRAVLLGRAPQVARVTNRELPRLVTVPSPNQDISRTHAEVRVEGEHVVVTDLDSTNGVHVSRPGEGVRRLHPGEPSVVGTDEVVDLGDGVTFTLERSAS